MKEVDHLFSIADLRRTLDRRSRVLVYRVPSLDIKVSQIANNDPYKGTYGAPLHLFGSFDQRDSRGR